MTRSSDVAEEVDALELDKPGIAVELDALGGLKMVKPCWGDMMSGRSIGTVSWSVL